MNKRPAPSTFPRAPNANVRYMFDEYVCTRERVCVPVCAVQPVPLVCVCVTQTHSRASFLREISRSVARVSAEGYSSQQTLPGLRTGVFAATNCSLLMRYIVTDAQLISFFPKLLRPSHCNVGQAQAVAHRIHTWKCMHTYIQAVTNPLPPSSTHPSLPLPLDQTGRANG